MATGDNVLTAVSVGRECHIINPSIEVFLGDIAKINGKEIVQWKSTKSTTRTLDRHSLTPN